MLSTDGAVSGLRMHGGGEFEVVQALQGGADDYVVKPWRPFELLARLRVLTRAAPQRANGGAAESWAGWSFDSVDRRVTHGALSVQLSPALPAASPRLARSMHTLTDSPLSEVCSEHTRPAPQLMLPTQVDRHAPSECTTPVAASV